MSLILWLIAVPAIVFIIGQIYSGLVSDFSPDEERREQAKKEHAKYQMATDEYVDWWFDKLWKLIKFAFKWAIPVAFVLFIWALLLG